MYTRKDSDPSCKTRTAMRYDNFTSSDFLISNSVLYGDQVDREDETIQSHEKLKPMIEEKQFYHFEFLLSSSDPGRL